MTNIVKLVKALVASDGSIFQKIRCRFLGRDQDLKVLNIYGHCFNPPKNSFGVAFAASGYDSDVHVIIDKPESRFTQLQEGEVKNGNYMSGAYIYFKADGSIDIMPKFGQVVNIIGDVTVQGTVTADDFITSVAAYNTHIHTGDDGGDTGVPK